MNQIHYWVYILYCNNNSYYTGYTTNLTRRYQEHLSGTAKCKYTRSFKPLYIAQCWQVNDCKKTAMKIEKFIKQLKKSEKQELILCPQKIEQLFSCKTFVCNQGN